METTIRAELLKYCYRHNYTIESEYTTYGETRRHYRARVYDSATQESYTLYYDPSGPKSLKPRKPRGWKNTTFENRRTKYVAELKFREQDNSELF